MLPEGYVGNAGKSRGGSIRKRAPESKVYLDFELEFYLPRKKEMQICFGKNNCWNMVQIKILYSLTLFLLVQNIFKF